MEIWETKPPGTLWATPACYGTPFLYIQLLSATRFGSFGQHQVDITKYMEKNTKVEAFACML
jgi:hypothetical protein